MAKKRRKDKHKGIPSSYLPSSKSKVPTSGTPSIKKKCFPIEFHNDDSINDAKVAWCFDHFDDHVWYCDQYRYKPFVDIAAKLKGAGNRTWREIVANYRRDHFSDVQDLSPGARDRLKALNYDDQDRLFRIRLSGTERVWGMRGENGKFYVLWWDPQHKVYETKPKKT